MMRYDQLQNDMGRYFRTLPHSVQEDLVQSGVVFHTLTDMRRCVQYLTGADRAPEHPPR